MYCILIGKLGKFTRQGTLSYGSVTTLVVAAGGEVVKNRRVCL